VDLAQTRLLARSVEGLLRRASAHAIRALCTAEHSGMERHPMNEFEEPNMGNPSVRFDEGRERVGHWPLAFQSILSRLLYNPNSVLCGSTMSGCDCRMVFLNQYCNFYAIRQPSPLRGQRTTMKCGRTGDDGSVSDCALDRKSPLPQPDPILSRPMHSSNP